MTPKRSRWRELAEFMSNHVLGDIHGRVAAAIVHADSVTHHLRKDGRVARPRLDHASVSASIEILDLLQQLYVYVRPLL
jgi:hypothetical protein